MGKGKVLTKKDADFLKQEFKSVFATKDNLINLKKEIASEVTKTVVPEVTKSVVPEVTKAVMPQIKSVVRLVISEELTEQEEKYEKKLDEFKSDFFEKIDPVLKEVTTAREERPLNENRLETLEKIHQKGKHSLPTY